MSLEVGTTTAGGSGLFSAGAGAAGITAGFSCFCAGGEAESWLTDGEGDAFRDERTALSFSTREFVAGDVLGETLGGSLLVGKDSLVSFCGDSSLLLRLREYSVCTNGRRLRLRRVVEVVAGVELDGEIVVSGLDADGVLLTVGICSWVGLVNSGAGGGDWVGDLGSILVMPNPAIAATDATLKPRNTFDDANFGANDLTLAIADVIGIRR